LISRGQFPKQIGLDSVDFLHSGTGYTEIAVFVLWLIFVDFGQNFQNQHCSLPAALRAAQSAGI